jgi:hypothetical protein
MRHIMLVLFATALAAPAQIVSFGVKAGVPLTNALPYNYGSTGMLDTGRWTVGPTVEVRLFRGLSAEVDLLYRGFRLQQSLAFSSSVYEGTTLVPLSSTYQQSTKIWDVPLLLKYRFGERSWRPFADLGVTVSHESSDITSSFTCLATADECNASNVSGYFHGLRERSASRTRGGPTAAVGVEFSYGKFKIAPEIRYTRYAEPKSNQATMMVGFTF